MRSFRSNLVLRWEWRPGSTLYLVWQQDREAEEMTRDRVSAGDMFGSLSARGDNFFAVKASFWFSPRLSRAQTRFDSISVLFLMSDPLTPGLTRHRM